MDRCMDEVWAVVQELPGNAREIWSQAFRKAMMEVNGDMRRAAAMAWMAFKGKEQRVGVVWDREKAAKGRLIVAAHGETPEWIRLVGTYGLVLENEGFHVLWTGGPCRRSLPIGNSGIVNCWCN